MSESVQLVPAVVLAKLRALRDEFTQAGRDLENPEIASDHRKVRTIAQRRAALERIAGQVQRLEALLAEAAEYDGLLTSPGADRDLVALAREDGPRVRGEIFALVKAATGELVQADDNAVGSIILEMRAGTGGEEAGLWTRDLLDMYVRYATKRGWSIETLELSGETGGSESITGAGAVRSAVLAVRGPGVWTAMNFEAGVHSVKRVPTTEAQGRIHTSTSTVAVLPEPEEINVKIDWATDVEEFATTSQGPGGQNVNKVATAVQVKHKATGIIIRMQESKSQQDNRQRARRLLLVRLHELERQKQHAARAAARNSQIGGAGGGERSDKIRTYRYKEGIVADERLPGEYALRDLQAGDFTSLHTDLIDAETARRIAAM